MSPVIEIGDAVHHGPSGEDWVIARVDGDHVYPAGWPCERARLADCTLINKATEQQRAHMIAALRKMPSSDPRHIAAEPVKTVNREALTFDQWLKAEANPALRDAGPLGTEWLRKIYEAGQRNAPPAPAVPDGWREFIAECATFAGKEINGNRLSAQAAKLLAAAPEVKTPQSNTRDAGPAPFAGRAGGVSRNRED